MSSGKSRGLWLPDIHLCLSIAGAYIDDVENTENMWWMWVSQGLNKSLVPSRLRLRETTKNG